MKKGLVCFVFLFLIAHVSATITVDIEVSDMFVAGEEIYFDYTITSDAAGDFFYSPLVDCPSAPLKSSSVENLNLQPNVPHTGTYVYLDLEESVEPQTCTINFTVINSVSPFSIVASKEVDFSIATKPSFYLYVNFCEDALCSENAFVFVRKEQIYIDYISEVDDPDISAVLTFSNGTSENIILPFSFSPNENGVHSLNIVASKEDYKTFTQTYNFAVIEEGADIKDADVVPYEDQEGYDSENLYWTNAYGENISIAQVGTTVRMVVANPSGGIYFEVFEYDSGLFGALNEEIRFGDSKIQGFSDSESRLIGKWGITDEDYGLSLDHGDYNFVNGAGSNKRRSGKLELIPINYDISFCEDYNDKELCETCSDYSCAVARNSVGSSLSDLKFGEAKCGEAYGDEGHIMDCFCKWDEDKTCISGYRAIPLSLDEKIGECVLKGVSNDNCDDGFFEISWRGIWEWHNNGFDPLELRSDCKDGSMTIPCPAQVKLSFFGIMQMVFALGLIGLIYFVLKKKKN